MKVLLTGARVFAQGSFRFADVASEGGIIAAIGSGISPNGFDQVFNLDGLSLFPGFVDVHSHLREPGFSYKETIGTGTRAAARGGYTAVCPMPNISPVPDCAANLAPQLEAIRRDAVVRVYPYGAITVGERGEALAELEEMAGDVIGFSDDGKGVASEKLMREAMERVARLGGIIAAHCEDVKRSGNAAEWAQVERDLKLAELTGCRYHVCHVSTRESLALIRRAKARGVNVTCETAPHYLLLSREDARDDGRYRMNPPLASRNDRAALIGGLMDGTIDMIATDHAPHSAEEKAGGFEKSLNGIVGLECAFQALNSKLCLPHEQLAHLMSAAPRARFGLPAGLTVGAPLDAVAIDLEARATIDSAKFASKGRATPFDGMSVKGEIALTLVGGRAAYAGGRFAGQ